MIAIKLAGGGKPEDVLSPEEMKIAGDVVSAEPYFVSKTTVRLLFKEGDVEFNTSYPFE